MTDTTNITAGQDDDFYDGATSTFPSVENLAPSVPPNFGEGRLVAIWAKENGQGKSNTDGKLYGFTETVTLVLDDGPDGEQFDELVPVAPQRVDMRHSTGGMHARLKGRVEGVNGKGVKLRYRPMIGRVNTQPSRNNKNVAVYGISAPTEDDMLIINEYRDMIIGINRELEAADAKSEDEKAFE